MEALYQNVVHLLKHISDNNESTCNKKVTAAKSTRSYRKYIAFLEHLTTTTIYAFQKSTSYDVHSNYTGEK